MQKRCPSCGAKNKKPIYKRVWVWLLLIIVVAFIAGTFGKENKIVAMADGILEEYNTEDEMYYYNGIFMEEDNVQVYFVTMRWTDHVYELIDEAVSGSQYPDITESIMIQSIANGMKNKAVELYEKLSETFNETEIICAVSIVDGDGNALGVYDDTGWGTLS